jgi:arylsulfatase A-like enzyme
MADKLPHVILLMADQLRRDCLSAYGDLSVRTPHLDSLAQESVVFDWAYCSTPLCAPTRTSIYSGKWPHSTGVIVNGGFENEVPYAILGSSHRTLYEQMRDAGLGLKHVGVHHCRCEPSLETRVPEMKTVVQRHWEQRLCEQNLAPYPDGYFDEGTRRPVPNYDDGRVATKQFFGPKAAARWPHHPDLYLDPFYAAQAQQLIEQTDWSRPQFFESLFWAPHPPFLIPDPYFNMYDPQQIELAETVGKWCDGQPASLLLQTCGALGAGHSREEYREPWAKYFGLVSMVDECLGKVVEALKAQGVWEDALVIFISDHGENLGCHALWEKHCCYEEAAHVPLLIKPPKRTAATGRRAQFAGHIDIAPTVCDYLGISKLPDAQGVSLRPYIEQPDAAGRAFQFIEYNGDHGRSTPMRAVVSVQEGTTYKYIYNFNDRDELYDLTADPHETQSLSELENYQTLRRLLQSELGLWMRETSDFLTLELQPHYA